jgi:hypothetical protein
VDFEFTAPPGARPVPICLVARELHSGRLHHAWLADGAPATPPYGLGPDILLVAYYSSAEWSCHLALDWALPSRVLDLFTEFRALTNGLFVPCGNGLLGALTHFGVDALDAVEKQEMRDLAIRGGPFTAGERQALLAYCQSDVDSLCRLLPAMLPRIDFRRALLRGRYMTAVSRMEWTGIPLDVEALARLRDNWNAIQSRLIAEVDRDYGVFVPAGQRPLNPDSPFGAAVIATAVAWEIDAHELAAVVDSLWRDERKASAEVFEARRAARRETGLTARRIGQIEDAGSDFVSVRGLDVMARELAASYPALGIGRGYDGEGYDDVDYAARLWDVLRQYDEAPLRKHDAKLLRRAAELVSSFPVGPSNSGPTTFSARRWEEYLARMRIPWPRQPNGALALDDETFRQMARAYPAEVAAIRELRHTLSQLRLNDLAAGPDGRNRCLLSPFRSKTGRNQPSNSRFIFGPSAWLRSLIRPSPGRAVAYCDWSAQELGIAASLSGDRAMQDAYCSGDPYLFLARAARAVPPDATKATHPREREQFKVVSLGVLYGLTAEGLARRLGVSCCQGHELLLMHRQTFPRFWQWSDLVEMEGMLTCRLRTAFGWTLHVGPEVNPRTLRNFPMQANGAEMMRLACCLATERGIGVCCPIHDALLVEGSADAIEDVVDGTQQAMREASELVLPGFPLRTDAKIVRWPDRYVDPRGESMWRTVWGILDGADQLDTPGTGARGWADTTPGANPRGPLAPVPDPSPLISLSL